MSAGGEREGRGGAGLDQVARTAILELLGAGRADASISTEAAARAAAAEGEDWRRALPAVKRAALALAGEGSVVILRHGRPVDPPVLRGVVRLGRGPSFPATS